MKHLFILIALIIYNINVQNITFVELQSNQTTEIKGNLNQGEKMESLRWAWNSSVACFPETQAKKFSGNHVLYVVDLPKHSELEVKGRINIWEISDLLFVLFDCTHHYRLLLCLS